MPSPDSRIARRFLRAGFRSDVPLVRALTRETCRPSGVLKSDHVYNLSDRQAIDLAARLAAALNARPDTQPPLQ